MVQESTGLACLSFFSFLFCSFLILSYLTLSYSTKKNHRKIPLLDVVVAVQPQHKAESRRFSGEELSTALQVQPSTPARGRLEKWASFTLTSVPPRSQDHLRPSPPLRGCCSNALERVTGQFSCRAVSDLAELPMYYGQV